MVMWQQKDKGKELVWSDKDNSRSQAKPRTRLTGKELLAVRNSVDIDNKKELLHLHKNGKHKTSKNVKMPSFKFMDHE